MARKKNSTEGTQKSASRRKGLFSRGSGGAEDQKLLSLIIELEKKSRNKEYPKEVGRVYAEIADTLSEAFQEYDPQQLPTYQSRLANIKKLTTEAESLQTPEFQSDLENAIALLDRQVQMRFGTLEKLKRLGGIAGSVLRDFSPAIDEIASEMQYSSNIGKQIGRVFGGRSSINNDERKHHFDILNSTPTDRVPNEQKALPSPLLGLPSPSQITPVKDDKLLSSNTKQNDVLIDLVKVSSDTNKDIKVIKNVLLQDAAAEKFSQEQTSFSNLETQLEDEASANIKAIPNNNGGLLLPMLRPKTGEEGESGGTNWSDMLTGYSLGGGFRGVGGILKKTASVAGKGLWRGLSLAGGALGALGSTAGGALMSGAGALGRVALSGAGTLGRAAIAAAPVVGEMALTGVSAVAGVVTSVLSSPIVIAALTAVAAVLIGRKLHQWIGPEISKFIDKAGTSVARKVQSISSTIGEKLKGVDYYRKLLTDKGLDKDSLDYAEHRTQEYLKSEAQKKRELFDKTYANDSSGTGTGDYEINGKSATRAEALADVEAGEKKVTDYSDYLAAKKEKGGGELLGTARFEHNGKVYTNPLYSADEQKQIEQTKGRVSNFIGPSKSKFAPIDDVDVMMKALGEAETSTLGGDTWDERRFVRTKSGADSSAYGPLQITYSRAESDLKRGLFTGNPELESWIRDKFIPQGKKMLGSSYSDDTYGAGGKGDLSGPDDREMYRQMARSMVGDTLTNYKGDVLETAGDWRFGAGKRDSLTSDDPRYARVVTQTAVNESQLMLDRDKSVAQLTSADVAPVPQSQKQDALDTLTKESQAQANQPIIIPQPVPAPAPVSMTQSNAKGTRVTGAPSSGATEPSFSLATRHNYSPI